jgi:hypothetical protein
MNRTRIIHIGSVICAALLGLAVRAWLKPDAQSDHASRPIQPATSVSMNPQVVSQSLAGESVETLVSLGADLRNAWLAQNPYRVQAAAVLRILRGAKTAADFTAALELIRNEVEDSSLDEHFVVPLSEIIFKRWAELDPAVAMMAASKMAGRQTASQMQFIVAKIWGAKDAPAALEFFLAQPQPFRSEATFALFQEIGASNPAEAMNLAQAAEAKGVKMDMVSQVLHPWSTQDAAAALNWVMNEGPAGKRRELVEACLQGMGITLGLTAAAEKLTALGLPQRDLDALLGRLMENGFSWPDDPLQGLKVMTSIQDASTRHRTIKQFASLGNFPDSHTEALLNGLPEGLDRQVFLAGHARNSIDTNDAFQPAEALKRIDQVSKGKEQEELWKELGEAWGGRDPVSASEWLNQEPAGPRRDAVTGEFVRSLFKTDPAAALTWAASINDPGKRTRRINELLPKWIKNDAPAAQKWLESSPGVKAQAK